MHRLQSQLGRLSHSCVLQESQPLSPSSWVILKWFFVFFFVCVHFGCSIGGRIYYNMDHLYFCIYLFITRPQPQVFFFPFHLSLPVGCTVCSHALCINILEINRSVLYFLYRWILIIKTFTRLLNKFSLIRKQKKLFCGFVWKVFLGKNK